MARLLLKPHNSSRHYLSLLRASMASSSFACSHSFSSLHLPSVSFSPRVSFPVRRVSCRFLVQNGVSPRALMSASVATESQQERASSNAYGSDQIQVLKGLEPVRKRPGMYIGSTGPRGLHHLVYEILDNAVDEAQAGYASTINVVLHSDNSVSITDNGRGIPTDLHPVTKKSALETVLTVLHAGGKFGGSNSGYSVSGGLHGVGLSVVNALSEDLEITVWRDGKQYQQKYSRGNPVTTLTCHELPVEIKESKGTHIRFWPDKEVFTTEIQFDYNTIGGRVRELAFLNPKLTDELDKVDEKLKATEALLESKNLEIKKINDEKKAALAAQFAAEATLRRVHAAQKDDEMPPIEAIITPLEAELKLARLEVAKLQDDNRALDRLTKAKEAALLEAERTVQIALVKASLVDDLQNKNQELLKQIEICQEENKILDKMHRQKVAEVEKLMQTVRELEEAVLAGGAAANAVRDYRRKVQEMNGERKTLEREVARAKVSANRVATVVANEWKDGNDKVMPVKQWLEERKFFQGEMQQLRDKLAVAERAAKAEAQLKEKYQIRFRVLEERLKAPNSLSRAASEGRNTSNGPSRRQSLGGVENFSRLSSNGYLSRKAPNSQAGSLRPNNAATLLKHAKMSSRSFDGGSRSLDDKLLAGATGKDNGPPTASDQTQSTERTETGVIENGTSIERLKSEHEDYVSGVLYDLLQKEVITLRRACHEKGQSLKDKDDAIEMLAKKVDTLNKAMEVEGKKMRREVAAMEKEVAAMRVSKEHDHRTQRSSAPRASQLLSSRSARNS